MLIASGRSHVAPLSPLSRLKHVWHHIVLVAPVDELGRVVPGEPAVHALRAAVDAPALLHHRHRAPLHLQHRSLPRPVLGRAVGQHLSQPHVLVQELTWRRENESESVRKSNDDALY